MGEIRVNSWVQHIRTSYKGSVIEVEGDYAYVHWFLYASGKPLADLKQKELCPKHMIKPLPPEPKIFSYDVLDIALQTEDEEWFNEITSLRGESVE